MTSQLGITNLLSVDNSGKCELSLTYMRYTLVQTLLTIVSDSLQSYLFSLLFLLKQILLALIRTPVS